MVLSHKPTYPIQSAGTLEERDCTPSWDILMTDEPPAQALSVTDRRTKKTESGKVSFQVDRKYHQRFRNMAIGRCRACLDQVRRKSHWWFSKSFPYVFIILNSSFTSKGPQRPCGLPLTLGEPARLLLRNISLIGQSHGCFDTHKSQSRGYSYGVPRSCLCKYAFTTLLRVLYI